MSIDASRSVDTIQKTGVEKVSDELLKQFVETRQWRVSTDIKIIFYTPQEISWLPKENQKVLHWPFKFFWTQIRLGFELIFHSPEIMFFPVHAMPLILFLRQLSPPARGKVTETRGGEAGVVGEKNNQITTPAPLLEKEGIRTYKIIHDIAFKKQPQLYSHKQRLVLNLDLWLAKKLCAKIFVPSQAVKDDLLKYTKISPEKIVIAHWGYTSKNFQFPILNQVQDKFSNLQINSKYQIPNPKINENNYGLRKKQILYIGRVEEKKNIGNLIKGFKIFNQKFPDYKLILAGKIDQKLKMYYCHPDASQDPEIKKEILNQVQDDKKVGDDNLGVEFLGFISEEKKYQLLAESTALAHVPKEEGFCFPMLEAFDFGLPVVASDIPVLREIGADACVYVNPDLPEDIARGLEMIMTETGLDLSISIRIEKGHERLKEFDWQKTAEKILSEIINFG